MKLTLKPLVESGVAMFPGLMDESNDYNCGTGSHQMCLFYEVLTFHSSRVVGNWVCNYWLSGKVLLRTQSYRKECLM